MKYRAIDSITLIKAIELLDQYHWLLSSTAQNTPVNPDIPLVLTSLRNIASYEAPFIAMGGTILAEMS